MSNVNSKQFARFFVSLSARVEELTECLFGPIKACGYFTA
jgi:hypothetical protein